jgi:colicin import membrane protein
MVNQPELELQLKVWKELAISKQMLMRAATDALKLDPNCTQEELKAALEGVLKKIAKADAEALAAREQAKASVAAMEKKVAGTEQVLAAAQATVAQLQAAQENNVRQMATERAAAAKDLQKVKDRIAEQERALKAINTALSDTPENVIKKMNVLKKQKQEEADMRRQIEASLNTLRTEKRQQDQKVADGQRNSEKLITLYRDLHAVSAQLHERAKAALPDAKDLPALPELDSKLLEEIEQPASAENGAKSKAENGSKAKSEKDAKPKK